MSTDTVEALFRTVTDSLGRTPQEWAAQVLTGSEQVLAAGPGAVSALLPTNWATHAADAAFPLRHNAVDGVCLLFALAAAPDVDALFGEIRRVLRPGGTLVVLTPSAGAWHQRRLRAAHRTGWTNRSGLDKTGWLLAAADFAVLADDRRAFTAPGAQSPDELAHAMQAAGLWPPAANMAPSPGPGPRSSRQPVMVPLRRLVARR